MLCKQTNGGSRWCWVATAMVSVLGGCGHGRLVLTADDVIALPDGKGIFAASVMRDYGSSFHQDLRDVPVQFRIDERPVVRGVTNRHGRVVVTGPLRSRVQTFTAHASVDGEKLQAAGAIYHWSPDRTIVAVDIDETISATSYGKLFFSEIDGSRPVKGAAEALWSISHDYQILYISARPEFLQEKTRRWLRDNRFPPAPYMGADRFEACLRQETYKRRILENVRAHWPNMLIGIGDKKVDDGAYGSHGMLTFIVNPTPLGFYSQRCVMMRDWAGLTRFFEDHAERLSRPLVLSSMIEQHGEQLRPAFAQLPSAPRSSDVATADLVAGTVEDAPAAGTSQRLVQVQGSGF